MIAMVCAAYGPPDVLHLKEVERPVPQANEVRVHFHAASINYGDWGLLQGKPFFLRLTEGGLREPKIKILGGDVAGRVEAVGRNATRFQPGDEVFGDLAACGRGGFAEYVCAAEDKLTRKPAKLSFEEAAAVPLAAVVALQGLRDKGQIRPGQKVLINGASGGVGTFAVQIAKSFGAEVTAVCSTRNLDLARSMGADQVIDYTREDYTRSGQRHDLILDLAAHRSVSDYRRALKPDGIFMMVGGSVATLMQVVTLGAWISGRGGQKIGLNAWTPNKREDLAFLAELFEAGKVVPVIDRRYPLHEVPEALRYLAEEPHLGKIVISVVATDGD